MSLLVTMVDNHDCERFFEVEDLKELKMVLLLNRRIRKFQLSDIVTEGTYSFFVVEYEDGIYIRDLGEESYSQWFTRLAKTLAFDDCSNERVLYIMYKGKELHYAGWKPGMLYEFTDKQNNIIWSASFPEWDH